MQVARIVNRYTTATDTRSSVFQHNADILKNKVIFVVYFREDTLAP